MLKRTGISVWRRAAASMLLLFAAGCGSRGELAFSGFEVTGSGRQEIYVATSRKPDGPPYEFGRGRSTGLNYMQFDVSIPTDHETGAVEWPGKPVKPDTQFHVAGATSFESRSAFANAVNRANGTEAGGEMVVYVHGYNTNLAEGVYRLAQISHDLKAPGTKILFSWPSAADPRGYVYDRDSALHARDRLQSLLEDLQRSGGGKILLVGHSMGSYLVTETLRQLSLQDKREVLDNLSGVVLMAPDIDVDVFRSQAEAINPLPQPFVLFVARQDKALRLSALLTNKKQRLGSIAYLDGLEDIPVTVIDVSDFASRNGLNHSIATSSPAAIAMLRGMAGQQGLEAIRSEQRSASLFDGSSVFGEAVRVELKPLDERAVQR